MSTNKVRKNIYLNDDLVIRAERRAEQMSISFGALVAVALDHYLSHQNGNVVFEVTNKPGGGETVSYDPLSTSPNQDDISD